MITRKSLADEIDVIDEAIKAYNDSKREAFDAYRDQMLAAGVGKPNVKAEIDAVKAAIKRRREAAKDRDGLIEKDALIDEVFDEITRAPRARVEIIEKFTSDGTKYDASSGEVLDGEFTTRSPRKAAEAVSERTAFQVDIGKTISAEATIEGQPSVTVATSAESAREAASSDLPTNSPEQAPENGSSVGTEVAASETSLDRVTPDDVGSADANTGGDHVTPKNAATLNNRLDGVPVQSAVKTIRPLCKRPNNCGGYGSVHCGSCMRAAREELAA